ncbi:MAG: glycoside hydrolase family 127 protein [Clostridia bacterium]|nr:glycoside hydrolase family 127 protein [Clostridia bacterium]
MDHFEPVGFQNVDITGGFWAAKQKLNRDVTIYAVRDRFADTGRFQAFECNWKEGSDEPKPHFFWDSDIAKWIESASYIIAQHPDPELEKNIEDVIDCIEKNQCADGYFNIYHQVVEPELRFRDRDHHELYCLGHLIEAAVAYYNATGRDRFLNILDKYIDLVILVFTVEKSAGFATPGHEEIELALIKLYRLKKDRKYLDLAMFFLNERGVNPEMNMEWCKGMYHQSHLPVREQRTAEGHSVRACYLYSGMADAAKETGDEALFAACRDLFRDITERKMYISGGVGSSNKGEAFTVPYDLPNDTAYAETCAAIALSFFADRMKEIDPDAKYADVVEREMYNGVLSGLSLDGRSFFYENPLEINLSDHTRHVSVNDHDRLPITQRLEVFGCSCCPPNVTRYIASLGGSVFSLKDERICVHQFMELNASVNGAEISMETNYPNDGNIRLTVAGAKGKKLCVRVPGWCTEFTFSRPYTMDRGYAVIDVTEDAFTLKIEFVMKPQFFAASPAVRADAGKAAMQYGPVVYCLESVDNGGELFDLTVDTAGAPEIVYDPDFGVKTFTFPATRTDKERFSSLYQLAKPVAAVPAMAKFIPYFAFANRGEADMTVWFRYR